MNNSNYNLFVYGSLRSGFQHDAFQYMAQYFNLLGAATVRGKLFDKGDYPVAIPVTEDAFIQGELYTAKEAHEFSYIIGQLDDYEGLYVEEGETASYKREETLVDCNGQQYTAWIYWYAGPVDGLPAVASGDVLQYLQEKNKQNS
ncbi:MAG: gamma-glutamylcyclotransferase family protein [Ferruginibacter sp.]